MTHYDHKAIRSLHHGLALGGICISSLLLAPGAKAYSPTQSNIIFQSNRAHDFPYSWGGVAYRDERQCLQDASKKLITNLDKMSNHAEFSQFLGQQASQSISASGTKNILGVMSGTASWRDTKNRAESYAAKQRGLVVAVNIEGWKEGTQYARLKKTYGPLGKYGGYKRKSNCGGTLQYTFAIYGPPASAKGSPAYQDSVTPPVAQTPAPHPQPSYPPYTTHPYHPQPAPQYQPAPYNPYPTIPTNNPYYPQPAPPRYQTSPYPPQYQPVPSPYQPQHPAPQNTPYSTIPNPQANIPSPNPYGTPSNPQQILPKQTPDYGGTVQTNNTDTTPRTTPSSTPRVADIVAPLLDKLLN